jgi:sirohydrochlorin ferrochelatase
MDMGKAVLLVGHGSRLQEANDALASLVSLVQMQRPEANVSYCFLQFAEPGISKALATLDDAGLSDVTVVPFFLYEGIHIREDIPEILAEVAAERPHMRIVLTPVLGIDERLADIVWDRVDAVPHQFL